MIFPPDFDFRVAAQVPVHLAGLASIMGKVSETLSVFSHVAIL